MLGGVCVGFGLLTLWYNWLTPPSAGPTDRRCKVQCFRLLIVFVRQMQRVWQNDFSLEKCALPLLGENVLAVTR